MTEKIPDRIDFAWKVHAALDGWVTKVDTKASIILALETAIVGFVISLAQSNGPLSGLEGVHRCLLIIGGVALVLGAFTAAASVFPQLKRRVLARESKPGIIYFGHLRRWEQPNLETHLQAATDAELLSDLARQLVVVSDIAWSKHVLLQVSIGSAGVGILLVILAAL